ncbi:MAG: membrane-associated protein [Acidobacteria bacterium]|nr:membrane-associated protein [Acidobacteriota bacterium]
MGWLLVWGTSYAWVWGWANFLHLCDIAVILTCVGLWRGSSLLISMQAVSSIVPALFWDLDFAWRLFSGKHLMGGIEYMWNERFPLGVRLLSLFHVAWPVLLVWVLTRVKYDKRALPLQTALAVVVFVVPRCVQPEANLNFAWRDPFSHQALGPGWLHLAITTSALVGCVYWPTHWLLSRHFSEAISPGGKHQQ